MPATIRRRNWKLLSERIAAWRAANLDVFVYFNNDLQGHAVHNARQLKALCAD